METGFIGLGRMGMAIAHHLVEADHGVHVYNRSAEPAQLIAQKGALIMATPARASACGISISMLADDDALEAMVWGDDGIISGLPPKGIHIAMGTHSVAMTERLTAAHASAGQTLIAAPVLGRPAAAAMGKLGIIIGGPADAIIRCMPLIKTIGWDIFEAGPVPAAASIIKIANNFLLGCAIEAMGEAFSLIERHGVAPVAFYEAMTGSLLAAPAYELYGKLIAEKGYDNPGFTARLGLKDANLAFDAAQAVGVPLPSLEIWRGRLVAAINQGEGGCDWAVIAREQVRRCETV